ncbi:MAG: NAD-binding protein, partial [Acidimicrobiia bacterium]
QYKQSAFLNPDDTPLAFSLDLVAKDLDLILSLAERVGVEMDQGAANREVARKAIAAGLGDQDMSVLAGYLRG